MDICYSLIGFILGIGVLVIVHELGHFYVARFFNVRILRFSIGFGPSRPIWYDKFGTEYVISAIPIGGYVTPLDTNEGSSDIKLADQSMAINKKSPWIRMLIFFAGPLFSILFAVLMYWLVFIIGISTPIPILGTIHKGTTADFAKLKSGLEIIKVNDQPVYSWEDITSILLKNLNSKNNFVKLETYDRKTAKNSNYVLNLNGWNINDIKGDILKSLGLEPFSSLDPKIWKVLPKYPAFEAGIKPGDLIIAINNVPMKSGEEVPEYIHDQAGKKINVTVKRNKEILSFTIVPVSNISPSGEKIGFIGIKYHSKPYKKELLRTIKYGVIDSFFKAIIKTYNYTTLSCYMLYETIFGKGSLNNVAGPIAIGYYAGQSIKSGLEYFLSFLGLASIGLGVLNLLPIPWLDGGSVVHCIYELIVGKPAPPKTIILARTISLFFLISLTIFVLINDLAKF